MNKLTDPYKIRRYMADRGWRSRDSIDFDGARWTYTVWFYRRDWHGAIAREPIEIADYGDPDSVAETVKRAARTALQLWNRFKEKVPGPYFDQAQAKHVWRPLPENQQPAKFRH